MSLDFLRVDGVMIQKVGLDAAVMHALIEWRSARYRTRVWVASIADITDDIGLSRRRIQVARDVLADAGMLVCERGPQSSLHWSTDAPEEGVLRPHVTRLKPDVAVSTSYREDVEDKPLADAPLSASEQETPMHDEQPLASVTPIDGGLFPVETVEMHGPTMNGQLLVKAWIDGYQSTHGHKPDRSILGPLGGAAGTIVKSRTDSESWHSAWLAFHACGVRGAFDIGSVRRELVKTTPAQRDTRPRWNENTYLRSVREDLTTPPALDPRPSLRDQILGGGA